MFSLFKKKKPHPMAKYYEHYTREEKVSILGILLCAAACDTDLHSDAAEELAFLNSYVLIFDIAKKEFKSYLEKNGFDRTIQNLVEMEKNKQELFLSIQHEMLTCDGNLNEQEAKFLARTLELFSMTEQEYFTLIQKGRLLYKFFTQ